MNQRIPAEAFPPGDFLREELEARDWTQTEFAEIIGRPARLVNEIIAGKRGVTPETAMDFAAAFGSSAQYWLNLETAYQLFKSAPTGERAARDDRISREAKLRERFPVRELIKRGWVESSESFDALEARVLSFFQIVSAEQTPEFAHAAKRNYKSELSSNQLAWLFRVRALATAFEGPKYSEKMLRDSLEELEQLTTEPEEIRNVPRLLQDCGVRLVVVEPLPGSKIDGACFWIDKGKTPVIGLSLLHDRIDNFWFVIRHEIEHILRGDGKDQPIIDEKSDGGLWSDAGDEAEEAANMAASEFCVPSAEIENFIQRVHPIYSEKRIIGFARRIKRHPGLIIGQIQYRTSRYNLLRKYLIKTRRIITQSALTDGYGSSGPGPM
ncbi:MAG: HigA family addiction module antidote protein [Roseibium sp.]|uniref:HigA family addiction module antitoxin n=1 Tax=Roseibium sp. TaxID=1936156 RepID=UPI00260F9A4F|nr:HigA family addiction module antitoxin [Roseibium sp.]MCV0424683.1 HigA family addiction module antidote protein [Roseibium sp.]